MVATSAGETEGQDERRQVLEEFLEGQRRVGLSDDGIELWEEGLGDLLFAPRMGGSKREWEPVVTKYGGDPGQASPSRRNEAYLDYARTHLRLCELCGFHTHLSNAEIETAHPSPLAVAHLLQRFKPAVDLLEPVQDLDESSLWFVEESDREALQRASRRAALVSRELRRNREMVEDQGFTFEADGSLTLPAGKGRPKKYLYEVIRNLYSFLCDKGSKAGNTREIQTDIQTILSPYVRVDLGSIRNAIESQRQAVSSRRSPNDA